MAPRPGPLTIRPPRLHQPMAKLNLPPTKSNLLVLKKQLAFAEEGYDLLEQKRQVLIFELMSRLARALQIEQTVTDALAGAFASLKEATLAAGSEAIERASFGVRIGHELDFCHQRLMGLSLPRLTLKSQLVDLPFGVTGTPYDLDLAHRRFQDLLPLLIELAQLQNALIRLSHELRKTQRRCNALSKIFIPNYRETIHYIVETLEERERESFITLKMIRNRVSAA